MHKKRRITSRFIRAKIFIALLFAASIYIPYFQEGKQIVEGLIVFIPIVLVAVLLLMVVMTRNIVYYDDEFFYVHHWRGSQMQTISNTKITAIYCLPIHGSFLWNTYIARYYDSPDKGKSFYFLVDDTTILFNIVERISKQNPSLITY
jgi:hypothetical protein